MTTNTHRQHDSVPGRVQNAHNVDLVFEAVEQNQRVSGAPETGSAALEHFDGLEIGVWEMTQGTMSDTEVDEVFVVLSGEATVTFADGRAVELVPGSVMKLRDGEKTLWTVRESLRKIYITRSSE